MGRRGHTTDWRVSTNKNSCPHMEHGLLIRGKGGYDPSSLYEQTIGEVGADKTPAESVGITINKAQWSKQMTVSGIRIITSPSIDNAVTGYPWPDQTAVREKLEEIGKVALPDGEAAYYAATLPATVKVKPKTFAGINPDWLSSKANVSSAINERRASRFCSTVLLTIFQMLNGRWMASKEQKESM